MKDERNEKRVKCSDDLIARVPDARLEEVRHDPAVDQEVPLV